MSMKRTRSHEFDIVNVDSLATVANYLMLLSRTTTPPPPPTANYSGSDGSHQDRVFECKTCNRRFPSFQALGGHRASHKKPKLSGPAHSSSENSSISHDNSYSSAPTKKTHECSICGAEFALGQALGGHMRRHRAALSSQGLPSTTLSLSLASFSPKKAVVKMAEKVMMMNVGSTLCLDLSL